MMLNQRARRAQAAVRLDRKCGYTPAAIICDQQTLAGIIHGQVTRPCPAGRLLVYQFESPCSFIDPKSTDDSLRLATEARHFSGRVQPKAVLMNRQETR